MSVHTYSMTGTVWQALQTIFLLLKILIQTQEEQKNKIPFISNTDDTFVLQGQSW
jgi:hypothetical protein